MIWIYVSFIIILLILFSNIGIRIKNVKNENYLHLHFLYLVTIPLNYDKVAEKLEGLKGKDVASDIEETITIFKKRKFINDILKKTDIKNLDIIYYASINDLNLNHVFLINSSFHALHLYLNNNVMNIDSENYLTRIGKEEDIDFSFDVRINLFDMISVLIRNTKKRKEIKYE